MEKLREFLRRPGILASAVCLVFALGFFLGSLCDRRLSADVLVVTKGASQTLPPLETVNINTAGAEELETLPGIGPVLASRIVEYRAENGPFLHLSELMEVEGIGSAVFERLQGRLTLD